MPLKKHVFLILFKRQDRTSRGSIGLLLGEARSCFKKTYFSRGGSLPLKM